MAEKVDKTPAGALPLLSMSEKKKKQARAGAAHPLPAVTDVILWTLLHVGIVTVSLPFSVAYTLMPPCLLPRLLQVTDAQVDMAAAGALMPGTMLWLWCVVSQAAAGALALMLPRHRRRLRLLLAYTALVATAAGHSNWAGLNRMLVAADPEGLYLRTVGTAAIFISGVGDLICFLGLVLRALCRE